MPLYRNVTLPALEVLFCFSSLPVKNENKKNESIGQVSPFHAVVYFTD